MLEEVKDILHPSGLDTLSERALRRLTDSWTGSLHPSDSLLDDSSLHNVCSNPTFHQIVQQWRKAREVYHDAPLGDVMGEGSQLASGVESVAEGVLTQGESVESVAEGVLAQGEVAANEIIRSAAESGLGEWTPLLYNMLIALTIIYYVFCIYRYFDDIRALFMSVFQRRVVSLERAEERRRSDIFYGSLGKLFVLGLAFVGVIASMVASRQAGFLTPSQLFYLPFVAMGAFVVVISVQYLMLLIVGAITHSINEVMALMRIRLIYFVMAIVMVAPILLISQMGIGASYERWQNVGYIAALIAFVLFIRESIGFFISKKVSILHWILYLCAVEILPLTLLWQGVIRLS